MGQVRRPARELFLGPVAIAFHRELIFAHDATRVAICRFVANNLRRFAPDCSQVRGGAGRFPSAEWSMVSTPYSRKLCGFSSPSPTVPIMMIIPSVLKEDSLRLTLPPYSRLQLLARGGLALVAIVLFGAPLCHAQGTYTAQTCSEADVSAVINGPTHTAVNGDTIIIPLPAPHALGPLASQSTASA